MNVLSIEVWINVLYSKLSPLTLWRVAALTKSSQNGIKSSFWNNYKRNYDLIGTITPRKRMIGLCLERLLRINDEGLIHSFLPCLDQELVTVHERKLTRSLYLLRECDQRFDLDHDRLLSHAIINAPVEVVAYTHGKGFFHSPLSTRAISLLLVAIRRNEPRLVSLFITSTNYDVLEKACQTASYDIIDLLLEFYGREIPASNRFNNDNRRKDNLEYDLCENRELTTVERDELCHRIDEL